MRKVRLLTSGFSLILAVALSAAVTPVLSANAEASAQTTSAFEIADVVKSGIKGGTSLVGEGDVFDYTLGVTEHTVSNNAVSTLFTEWTDFDTVSEPALKFGSWNKADYNLSGSPYGPYFNAKTADSNCQVRVNWVQNITYKLTFNKAAVLTVTNEALSGIATTDNVIRIRTYKETNGEFTRLSEKSLYDGTNTSQAENYFGGEYTMAAGESFYFEYGCTGPYEKSLKKSTLGTGIFPTFTADASKITDNVTTDLLSLISASYGANGGDVKRGKTNFSFRWGTITENQEFDLCTNNALQTNLKRDDGLYAAVYAGGSGKFVRTNGAKQKFFLKLTAEADAKISFNNEAIAQATNGSGYYNVYEGIVEAGATHYAKRFETVVGNDAVEAGVLAFDMHVPAGHEVVFEIYGSSYGTNIYLLPTIAVDFDAYDETNIYDFTEIVALATYKAEKLSALQDAYNQLDRTDYLSEDLVAIDAAYASSTQDIKEATDIASVDLAIEGYESYFAEIVTVTKLSELKVQYKARLDEYLATVNESDYSAEDYATILALIEEGKAKIEASVTEKKMDTAVKHAIAEIELISKALSTDTDLLGLAGINLTCSSTAGASAITALVTLVGSVILLKKKED